MLVCNVCLNQLLKLKIEENSELLFIFYQKVFFYVLGKRKDLELVR